ncbi:MAG TPA: hypothetical protein PKJ41_20505, partial [Bryobacteraceae bacterium]|nr:hypothetical protein [Bryobacteraceae bacterium]
MNKVLITVLGLAIGTAGLALGQAAANTEGQPMGRGRGGAPHAWNDKNKDGVCDVTNQPVSQRQGQNAMGARGRGRGQAGMRSRGRGFAGGMSRGFGRGMGRGMGAWGG